MKHVNKLLLGTFILAAVNLTYAEDKDGFNFATSKLQSTDRFVAVGKSTKNTRWMNGIHSPNKAGIGFKNGKQNFLNIGNKEVKDKADFEGLTHSKRIKKITDSGITVNRMHKPFRENKPWWDLHGDLGSFNFVKAGAGDVWFGEWSQNGNDGSTKFVGRQVFYIGDKKGYKAPKGKASYTITGMNKFVKKGDLLKGEIDADFTRGSLSGTLATYTLNAKINNKGSFVAGKATHGGDIGNLEGSFFGNGATSVAGMAEFEKKNDLNVSFGGKKD